MPDREPDVIEASFTEVKDEPRPEPATAPLGRDDVLKAARVLNSQVIGLAGTVEQAALVPGRVRPVLLTAWRSWSGKWFSDIARLEATDPIDPQAEARRLAGYAGRLAELRQAVAAELAAPAAQVGEAGPEVKPLEQISAGSWRRWPLWLILPAATGTLIGSYMAVRWMFKTFLNVVTEAGDREQAGKE